MVPEIFSLLEQPFTGEALFDHLHDIVFFVKNERCEYVVVNQTLVSRCGKNNKAELLGKTPTQLLRAPLGARYEEQDRRVIESGQSLTSQLELHVYPTLDTGWCLTTKMPMRGSQGTIIGLVGVSQDVKIPDFDTDEFQHLADAIAFAKQHLANAMSVEQLAKVANMSRYQLDRRMRRVFGLTTGQWLIQLKIDRAQRKLQSTTDPIASIALDVGYSDQSAFTRQFRQATGMSPRDYRLTYQQK
ncbi:AraC family transcriptional regulator [Rhodopirellula sp. MGV]|uniref:AraC family transcriptional regulator n=1 Tax=Rhodopirellula sp. MGV TaxID=2023130 RepID=UPI000B96787F|nr:AraC family transcriptional regulator [Rhodopirellula sp. MGV]OYP28402.1 AraC family transcriptional regulator [Rhodopirellula sp. MGV]PNY38723.1 AraC family transcriptional regulator [Rhodopirellula baltica]